MKRDLETIPVFKPLLGKDTVNQISKILDIGWLGMGTNTKEFEELLSQYFELENRYVIATNTATSALHLALRAMGIGEDDEVITPSFNCVADQQAIRMTRAEPVMCDILEGNLGIDCEKADELISEKTKAIIPLHYAGIPCNQKEVYSLAKKYGLRVIEDCCHAIGTKIQGKKLGSYGDSAFFSFDPVKTITSVDGGCIIVNDQEEFEQIQHMRLLGMSKDTIERYKNKRAWDYDVNTEGYRYHLNNVMAGVGISQIKKIEKIISTRQEICREYNKAFTGVDGLVIPNSDFNDVSPFIYVIRVLEGKREKVIDHLKNLFIETGIHWKPVHKFSYFKKAKCGNLDVTNKIADEILTLPLHSMMNPNLMERVKNGILTFFKK